MLRDDGGGGGRGFHELFDSVCRSITFRPSAIAADEPPAAAASHHLEEEEARARNGSYGGAPQAIMAPYEGAREAAASDRRRRRPPTSPRWPLPARSASPSPLWRARAGERLHGRQARMGRHLHPDRIPRILGKKGTKSPEMAGAGAEAGGCHASLHAGAGTSAGVSRHGVSGCPPRGRPCRSYSRPTGPSWIFSEKLRKDGVTIRAH